MGKSMKTSEVEIKKEIGKLVAFYKKYSILRKCGLVQYKEFEAIINFDALNFMGG